MKKTSVLIADDHVTFSEGLQRVLADESDMEVVDIVYNGEDAVRIALVKKPDIVLMDIAMPDMNGIEATKRIKEHLPSSAVLILSAYGYTPYVFSALEAGAAGYLLKNIPPSRSYPGDTRPACRRNRVRSISSGKSPEKPGTELAGRGW